MNATPARTERLPPQHSRLNTGEAPPTPPELREGERERGERKNAREGERRGARERGKGSDARALSPDPEKATYHPVATGTRSEGDSHLVAFTRHRQSRTDTKDACHVCQTASGATRWEGDIGHVAFKKATYPMSPSTKPGGDSGCVAFKKATYPLSQSQAEPDSNAIKTTSRQSPCRDPEDGAKGPRGPGCYKYGGSVSSYGRNQL
ncbi:hypothetical protein Taro_023852 [Colocasia esculenta]|uniref:Uncharacterized protein n=1 Tax=Colocasia esculenta TaxID=4460 RepID=A0A843UYK7_COLES|nr:hypothetical protein [Colocasia esculenta]